MSILFCELVGLQSETVKETMVVVSTMNEAFSAFDQLMDQFNVYKVNLVKLVIICFKLSSKVETVGQIYMAACGAPEKTENHAEVMAKVAISMLKSARKIQGPSGLPVEVKIGSYFQYLDFSIYLVFCFRDSFWTCCSRSCRD